MISNYHYRKQIFLSAHFLIGVQWLGTNCQMKHVRWGCNEISTLTVNYVRIISHIMYVTNQIQKAFTEWNKHKIIHSSV